MIDDTKVTTALRTEFIRISVDNGRLQCDPEVVTTRPNVLIHWECEHPFAILFKDRKTPFGRQVLDSMWLNGGHVARELIAVHPKPGYREEFPYGIAVVTGDEILALDPIIVVYE